MLVASLGYEENLNSYDVLCVQLGAKPLLLKGANFWENGIFGLWKISSISFFWHCVLNVFLSYLIVFSTYIISAFLPCFIAVSFNLNLTFYTYIPPPRLFLLLSKTFCYTQCFCWNFPNSFNHYIPHVVCISLCFPDPLFQHLSFETLLWFAFQRPPPYFRAWFFIVPSDSTLDMNVHNQDSMLGSLALPRNDYAIGAKFSIWFPYQKEINLGTCCSTLVCNKMIYSLFKMHFCYSEVKN